MSSALVRQALAFVEQEEDSSDKRKSGSLRKRRAVQDLSHPYKRNKKTTIKDNRTKEQITEENIKKLLALSSPTADSTVSQKIVDRAIKGRPLAEKVEVIKEAEKSILFPEEPFHQFEQKLFCGV